MINRKKISYLCALTSIALGIISLLQCKNPDSPSDIVDNAIAYSGGDLFDTHRFEFEFRKYHIKAFHSPDSFHYVRTYYDGGNYHKEVMTSDSLNKFINEKPVEVSDKDKLNLRNSINSQVYFVMLPKRLKDPAAKLKNLGVDTIAEKPYFVVEATFEEEGGGVDYEDIYRYWFDQVDYSLDYLAYLFHVNKGGIRMRKAYNERRIDGIVFQDYVNYKTKSKETPLDSLGILLDATSLDSLSIIETTNPKVEKLLAK